MMKTTTILGLALATLAMVAVPQDAEARRGRGRGKGGAAADKVKERVDLLVAAASPIQPREARLEVRRKGLNRQEIRVKLDDAPQTGFDLDIFFDVMEANEGRKVFVHCFANMRASAFVYLYRTLVQGVPDSEARGVMSEVWDPGELQQWADLIERAKAERGQ